MDANHFKRRALDAAGAIGGDLCTASTGDAAATLVDLQAAAQLIGVSRDVLYNWQRDGKLPVGVWAKRPSGIGRERLYPIQIIRRLAAEMRAPFPPTGWLEREEAARRLGIGLESLNYHAKQGTLAPGRLVKKPGSRARVTLFASADVEAFAEVLRAAAEAPFPPAGFVDRCEANRILGVGAATLDVWKRSGRFTYDGELVPGPNGVACRVYAVAELEKARDAMAMAEAKESHIPAGHVDMDGAAAFFGKHKTELNRWQIEGRLSRGAFLKVPGRPRFAIFAIAELERVKAAIAAEKTADAARPIAPEGFIDLHAAAQRLGVSPHTLGHWDKRGRIVSGQWTQIPGTSARTKIYPVADIDRLLEEIRIATEAFPPEGWVEMGEAAWRANVSVTVWKGWLGEGRFEDWKWASRPTMARCKLFKIEAIDRLIAELGRDHHFFMEADGAGGWQMPEGYVGRADAAKIFGVAENTFVHWQTDGRIACGRWARMPIGVIGTGGRRAYPIEELERLAAEFAKAGKAYLDPEDPTIARVPVMSWSKTRFEAIIDAADLPLIEGMRWNWSPASDGETAMVVASAPSGEQIPLRRVLLGLKGIRYRMSHRNGDGLDCRRANIVVRDHSDTLGHARKRRTCGDGKLPTSRFKGVSWNEKSARWYARISKDGVQRGLGRFEDEIAAAQAYDEAANEVFGEHARLNFPDGVDAWLEREAAEADAAAAADQNGDAGADAIRPAA